MRRIALVLVLFLSAPAALAGWDARSMRESQAAAIYRFVSREMTADSRAATMAVAERKALLEWAIARGLVTPAPTLPRSDVPHSPCVARKRRLPGR